ncbi:MAG: oligosaccharide flippase family protein, partial [Alphaproteobacteria bacterium]
MSVKRALAVTGISQQLVAVITLCKTVVISRVLTPEEVGVYALAMAFLFFVQNMRLFGCYEYTLAEKDLTNDKLRACFSIVLTSSSNFLVLFLVGADVAAGYFDAPGLGEVLHILSISFLVNCFSIFTVTLLNRHMRFAELAVIQISAALLDLAVAVPLALNGYGANALAWGFVAASLLT